MKLHLTSSVGCYYTDDEGRPWTTFELFHSTVACATCGTIISRGYSCGKWGEETYHCAAHVVHVDMLHHIQTIQTRQQLQTLAHTLGVRRDWHEPDEQNLTLQFGGYTFDNAMGDAHECHVVLCRRGCPVAVINLANLLAWASE